MFSIETKGLGLEAPQGQKNQTLIFDLGLCHDKNLRILKLLPSNYY